jgi:hypothetical protein
MKYQTPRVIELSARAASAKGEMPLSDAACVGGQAPADIDCWGDCLSGGLADLTCRAGSSATDGACRSGTSHR